MSNLMLDVDQAGELKAAFRRGDWTNQEIKRLCEGDVLAQFRQVLLGNAVITERQPSAPKPEPMLDIIIRVNRAVRPAYPDWARPKWINSPEFIALEATGPVEYDFADLQLWLHDGQKSGTVRGQVIYDHLKTNNELINHIGFTDLLEIQKKGIVVFREFFAGKVVFGWKSVVQNRNGHLSVPYLLEFGDGVVLDCTGTGLATTGAPTTLRLVSQVEL